MVWRWVWELLTLLHLTLPSTDPVRIPGIFCTTVLTLHSRRCLGFIMDTPAKFEVMLTKQASFSITSSKAFPLQSNLLSPGQEAFVTLPIPTAPDKSQIHLHVTAKFMRGENSQAFRSDNCPEYLNPSLGLMRRNTTHQRGYWWKSVSEVLPSNFRSCFACKTTCLAHVYVK